MSTIQGELEKAVLSFTGKASRIQGAGRTDAGVHARGQVAAFETDSKLSSSKIIGAMNFHLPEDIAIRDACQVETDFDPRRDATSREYRYTILNRANRSPLDDDQTYRVSRKLDIGKMNEAGKILQGEHDFVPFTNQEGSAKNTIRKVYRAEVQREGDFIWFDMLASAFLPQQVRRTIGSLIKIGTGDMEITEFREIAKSGITGAASQVAPAHGLCLMKVNYSKIGFGNENI